MYAATLKRHACSESDSEDAPLRILKGKQIKTEESSNVYCAICMDEQPDEKMFKNQHCSHIFCNDCIRRHVAAKIEENRSVVECPHPSCKQVLEPHQCRSIIPEELFDKWGNVLCQNLVPESEKFYCPFKDCSAMMICDCNEVVSSCECPHCNRIFCAQCKVSWHAEIGCEEFQKLEEAKVEKGDSLVMELAKSKSWRRCPKCSFYVERIEGCCRIVCRFVLYF
ncbi:hypothetical protein ACSQ67_021494 [Phaseolus vulgaris]